MRLLHLWALLLLLCLPLATGCKDITKAGQPSIRLQSDVLAFRVAVIGQSQAKNIVLQNEGTADLKLSSVSTGIDAAVLQLGAPGDTVLSPGEQTQIVVTYTPRDYAPLSGVVTIRSNDPTEGVVQVAVNAPASLPLLLATPDPVDFGVQELGANATQTVTITNNGYGPANICEIVLTGDAEVTSDIAAQLAAAGIAPGETLVLAPKNDPSAAAGAGDFAFTVIYDPQVPGDTLAAVLVRTDDKDFGAGGCKASNGDIEAERASWNTQTIPVLGRAEDALLDVSPQPIDFGESPIEGTKRMSVTIRNIGGVDLRLNEVSVDAALFPEFGVEAESLPTLPRTLAPDESVTVIATFRARLLGVPSAGYLHVEYEKAVSGERADPIDVAMTGVGAAVLCPIAVAKASVEGDPEFRRAAEVDWAQPLDLLHLDGSESYDPDGGGAPLSAYRWSIVQRPDDAVNGLQPDPIDPLNPALQTFTIYFAGEYRFRLEVADGQNIASCETADVIVRAFPNQAIAIEVAWHNPNDPDESDTEGADLDSHFVKMSAPWFDATYDTYFENKEPLWSPESPSLDIDDTDGIGPETTTLGNPADCQWYAVGVHYFREAYGTAYATVRIYVNGEVQAEYINRPLRASDDFWDVARIHWNGSTATIFDIDEITPDFDPTSQTTPISTPDMLASGLCGGL